MQSLAEPSQSRLCALQSPSAARRGGSAGALQRLCKIDFWLYHRPPNENFTDLFGRRRRLANAPQPELKRAKNMVLATHGRAKQSRCRAVAEPALRPAEPLCTRAEGLCSAQSRLCDGSAYALLRLHLALHSLATQIVLGSFSTTQGAQLRAAGRKGAGEKDLGGDPWQSQT